METTETTDLSASAEPVDLPDAAGLEDLPETHPTITNVQDTAYLTAYGRAKETERDNALFRDPFATLLLGDRIGDFEPHRRALASTLSGTAVRTHLMDQVLLQTIKANAVDLVVCLAAGLDARPYRLALPKSLRWVEVDLPDMTAHKDLVLAEETPQCFLKRVALDLSNAEERQAFLKETALSAKRILVVAEGLLLFLAPEDVRALASELRAAPAFQWLLTDIVTPMGFKSFGPAAVAFAEAGAPIQFTPEEGPGYIERLGWEVLENHSLFDAQAKHFPEAPGMDKYRDALQTLPPQWKKKLRMAITLTLFQQAQ